jgi:enoyl-CoA hydratase
MNARIHRYPKPFVAIMNGVVLGGGIGIAGHASHRIVTDSSRLGMPETGIGFVPDVGGTWLLSHAPGELGTHLALTAGSADAGDALALGLADYFIASDRLTDFAAALQTGPVDSTVERFAGTAPGSPLAGNADWINTAYAADDMGQIIRRLKEVRNAPADAALELLAQRSPTSLTATLAALRRARSLPSLEATLEQDFRVSLRLLDEPDLAEGIRAQVIDKDRNPRWSPATLEAVDDAHIQSLFLPLGELELVLDRATP